MESSWSAEAKRASGRAASSAPGGGAAESAEGRPGSLRTTVEARFAAGCAVSESVPAKSAARHAKRSLFMIPYLSRHTVLPELRIAHKSTGKSRLYRLDGNVHRAEV